MNWEFFGQWLSIAANIAAVVTGVVALIAGARFLNRTVKRRRALEAFLKHACTFDEEYSFGGKGERTVLFLTAQLAMTESQVLGAAFSSQRIKRWLSGNPKSGRSDAIYFQYDPKGGPAEISDYIAKVNEGLMRNKLWHAKAKDAESQSNSHSDADKSLN